MQAVTVSPKYQIVIPRPVRDNLHLRPGQKMQIVEFDGRIDEVRISNVARHFLDGCEPLDSDITGPSGTPDCYVDLFDFALLGLQWLQCSEPVDSNCTYVP